MNTNAPKNAADTPRLSELKAESESLLHHLMLEQQHKLRQMVQQLKAQPHTSVPANTPVPQKEIPSQELAKLQQQNVEYLDRLTADIEATINNLHQPEPENKP